MHILTRSFLGAAALGLALSSSTARPISAGDALGARAELQFGPLIGGKTLRFDLRTQVPSTPVIVFFGFGSNPTVLPDLDVPVIGVSPAASFFFLATDADGRLRVELPLAPGFFPVGTGAALHTQAAFQTPTGHFVASAVRATELAPLPALPGFLVDESASLPLGADGLGANTIESLDFDRDGRADLALSLDGGIALYRNTPSGFVDETSARIAHPGDAVSTLGSGDVDNDGDFDLISGGGYADFESVPDRLWLNDGTGVFTLATGFPAGEGLTRGIELADVDGDGDLDALVANGREGHLTVPGGYSGLYRNDGSGVFTADSAFASAVWNENETSTNAIRAGDLDGDGDLDLYLCKSDPTQALGGPGQQNVMLVNDGSGSFTDVTFTLVFDSNAIAGGRSDTTFDAALIDIDGDGDLDIVNANSVSSIPASSSGDIYINAGGAQGLTEGLFVENAGSALESSNPLDNVRLTMNTADIDADGDADLLCTVHDLFLGAHQMLFLNQGGAQGGLEGNFARQHWFDPGDFISNGAAIFDCDNDGDLDLAVAANGVVGGNPAQGFGLRFYRNGKL
jgi:hypothetical protein